MLILVDDVHAETVRMVDFAKSLEAPWQAVFIGVNPEKAHLVQQKWQDRIGEGEFVVGRVAFPAVDGMIEAYIKKIQAETPDCFAHVIMGHLVMDTFWEQALHQNSAFIFNLALGHMERVVVTSVPYQVHRKSTVDEAEDVVRVEEPSDVWVETTSNGQ